MSYRVQQSTTAYPLLFLMVQSSDHVTPLTGAAPTVKLGKNGGTGAAPAGTVTEIDSTNLPGWYKVAGNATDNNTLGSLTLHATAASGDPSDTQFEVVAQDLTTATVAAVTTVTNLTNAPTAGDLTATQKTSVTTAATAATPVAASVTGNVGGNVVGTIGATVGSNGIKKNTAKNAFMLVMTDAILHTPKTGLAVTFQRSLNGAAFANGANAVTEIGSGWYKVDLAAGDVNGDTVGFKFTATGADQLNIGFVTAP